MSDPNDNLKKVFCGRCLLWDGGVFCYHPSNMLITRDGLYEPKLKAQEINYNNHCELFMDAGEERDGN